MDSPHTKTGMGSILIVDDDRSARQILSALMEGEGCEVRSAPSGRTALIFAREEPPELILLDVRLPDVDGFEVCRQLKEDAGTRGVPVIFLSALEDAKERVKGFEAGGADYITKPFHAEEVLARVRTHVALYRLQTDLERRVAVQTAALRENIEALNRSEEALKERLRFETLLTDLSAQFVNLPVDQVDREIGDGQRRVCELLGLDLSALWQWSVETPGAVTLTQLYRPLGGPPPPEPMDAHEYFPWSLQQVLAGKVVTILSTEDVPAEAVRDQQAWRHYGIKTILTFPLSAGGGPPLGAISFNTTREERTWPEEIVRRLQLIAEIFANALARKQADQALRESEARLTLAAASADAGLWELDLQTRRFWSTDKARNLFGLPADSGVTFDTFLALVHPEDRERIQHTVEQVVQSGEGLRVEYRSLHPDGSVRWMASRGRHHPELSATRRRLMGVTIDITERKQMEEQLRARLLEIESLKQQLEHENTFLREEVKHLFSREDIVGQSRAMRQALALVQQVAPTDSTVLIAGETGTGKEVIARAIHNLSKRKERTLVTVNCASLPPSLIESELFGREKGAYTGAMTMMKGRFEVADGSTLFLDEIGEMPLDVQAKLLRVLEEGSIERLGSTKTMHMDVRIIAASNRDLAQDVQQGKFRQDLYYRLNVFPIAVPPLRERPEDIPLLVWTFVREFENKMGKRIESIPKRTMEAIRRYPWPGNVRELRNVIEHAMIVSSGKSLDVRIPTIFSEDLVTSPALEDVERKHILSVLEKSRWRLTGQGGAAERLGLKRTTLYSRMKKLGIKRPTS
jgi:formate hydrogenlyase transcriptional activator